MVTLYDIVEQRERVQSLYAEARRMHKRAAHAHERLKQMQYQFDKQRGEERHEGCDAKP